MTVTTIGSGITSHSVILNTGDILNVQSGGTANATVVNSSGTDNVLLGGTTNDTVVNNGGSESLSNGGSAVGTIVTGGGAQFVHAGATAENTTVNNLGNEYVDGVTSNTMVNSGGTEALYNSSVANGSVVNNGGTEFVHAGSTTKGVTINSGGAVFLASGAIATGGITFSGDNAKLDIDGTAMPATAITGFAITDEIDLGGLAYAASDTVSVSGDIVTVTGTGGASETLTIIGAQRDAFNLSAELDGDGGTKLAITSATGNPVVSSPTLAVNGNTATTAIGIVPPTDPNYSAARLSIIVQSLPNDGGVLLADGATQVTAGQSLTSTQLSGLLFAPAYGQFGTSSALTYTVTDPAGNSSTGAATLTINPAVGNPVVSSPMVTVAENGPATLIGIAAPIDPNYTAAQLTITAGSVPGDGTVTLGDGTTPVTAGDALTVAQLTGLLFTPTYGLFATNSEFTYSVADPSGNASSGAATLAIGAAFGEPVVSSPTIVVAANAGATAIGIAAPTDPNYDAAQLTIAVTALPTDGSVTLGDGVTAVTAGQALTSAQLTALMFTPATGRASTSSAFTYTVTDPANNASTGAATLAIGPAAPALTTSSEIVNNVAPMISGMAEAGGTVTLFSSGTAIGSTTADAATGVFALTPTIPLALGLNTLSATVTTAGGTSASSATIAVFDLPSPDNGVSTTDSSSSDLGAALSQGAKFSFTGGTEAIVMTDSTLSVGPDTNEATIQRSYEGLLGRGNDTGGMTNWDAALTSGLSKVALVDGFLNSGEYVAGHGTQSDEQLVISLYQGVLGRAPDSEGQADWMSLLSQGMSRGDVALGFIDSTEAKAHLASTTAQVYAPNTLGTLLHELFETGFGREIELAGLTNLKTAFASLTPAQVAADIAGSQEFMNDHTGQGNAAYVSSLYQAGLGRAPDAPGAATWTGMLDNGTASRADELLSFATSTEGVAHMTYNFGA